MESKMNFIIVNKVTKQKDGALVTHPERIPISDIKNYRVWFKKGLERMTFKDQEVTVIYMKSKSDSQNIGDSTKSKKPYADTVMILESVKSLDERLGVIQL